MKTTLTTRIIKIGNAQAIRLPKHILQQAGLSGEIAMQIQAGQLVLRPMLAPRQGWEEAFQTMADLQDDRLLDEQSPILTDWEENEWQW